MQEEQEKGATQSEAALMQERVRKGGIRAIRARGRDGGEAVKTMSSGVLGEGPEFRDDFSQGTELVPFITSRRCIRRVVLGGNVQEVGQSSGNQEQRSQAAHQVSQSRRARSSFLRGTENNP